MKINPIFYGIQNSINKKSYNCVQKENNPTEFQDFSKAAEVVGRSLVNFKARVLNPQDLDALFINNLGNILRFRHKDDFDVLKKIVDDFKKENKISSLEEIATDGMIDKQVEFLISVVEGCCLDNHEEMLVATEFSNRLYNPEQYEKRPADKYSKDFASIAAICHKYQITNKGVKIVYSVLSTIAQQNNFDSIFDIFNKSKNPDMVNDLNLIKEYSEVHDFENFVIDIGSMANKSEFQRNLSVDSNGKWFKFLKNYSNNVIASAICAKYGIEPEFKNMLKLLDKRIAFELDEEIENHISNAEIAFTLMDKYGLPLSAFDDIKNTLSIINSSKAGLIELDAIAELINDRFYENGRSTE